MVCTTRAVRVADSKYIPKHAAVLLALSIALASARAVERDIAWPQMPIPRQIQTFEIGQNSVVNGTPVRMRGFVSPVPPDALVKSFRQLIGEPVMADRRGNTLVLGRAEGRYYVTVQLDPAGAGTRGVIAVSRPPIGQQEPPDAAAARRLLSSMPPGSTLASHTLSIDGATSAVHDTVVNSHSIGINSEYVQRMLRSDGFRLERESGPSHASTWRAGADARTLWFKRVGAEAIAVLFSDDSGKSVIVLNRITRGSVQ